MFKNTIYFCNNKTLLVLLVIIISGCGQRGNPSGGEKDTIAPQVVESIPDSCGLNFKGEKNGRISNMVKYDHTCIICTSRLARSNEHLIATMAVDSAEDGLL